METTLLDKLACPKCRSPLTVLPRLDGLKCPQCDKVYPIKGGIPYLLVEEAVPASQWELSAGKGATDEC